MDFYYAMTNYHVLCCLLHKMIFNENKAILYVSTYLKYNQPEIVDKIKDSKIFEEVCFYDEVDYKKTEKIMPNEELEKEIKRICNIVEKRIGKTIKKANNIYVCSDFYSIGLYLINKKIGYYYFEDGCGALSRPYLPFRPIERENPNRAKIVKMTKAFGENEYVINRFADLDSQEEAYYNSKDIDFSVKKILKGLSKRDLEKILKVYDIKKRIINDKNNVLLLTMHYDEIFSKKEQLNIYSYLMDYFTTKKDKIIIKPHPSDNIRNYKKIFNNVIELNRYMPSELLPYCIDKSFNIGLTCWSTAIYGLKNIINRIIVFNVELDSTYKEFDEYYSVMMLLKKTKKEHIQNIKMIDINYKQLIQLMKYHFKDYQKYYNLEECNEIKNINKEDIIIIKKLENPTKNRVIELDNQFKANYTMRIIKKYNNYNEYSFIGLYNYKKIDLSFEKEMYYSNYNYSVDIISSEEYLNCTIMSLEENKKRNDIICNEYDNEIKKCNDKIWELEQHTKYLDGIISKKESKIDFLKNRNIFSVIKDKIRTKVNIKEDNE